MAAIRRKRRACKALGATITFVAVFGAFISTKSICLSFQAVTPLTGPQRRASHHVSANFPAGRLGSSSEEIVDSTSFDERSRRESSRKHLVIVGGGVGGLAVASRVASFHQGDTACRVTIVEKNEFVGGRCGSFSRVVENYGRFRHERGPSLLLLPDVYRELFRDCADKTTEQFGLEMRQCVPAYQVVFEDGDSIEVGFPRQPMENITEAELQSRETMDRWEANGSSKWDNYMRATSAFLDAGLSNFIEERIDLSSLPNFLVEALRDFAKSWPLKPHSDVLDAIFKSEKMKALASFQDLYVGLEPYRNEKLIGGGVLKSTAPAVFGLLAAIELHPSNSKSGVFAPVGGFQAVTSAMEELTTKMGVEFLCNTTVTAVRDTGIEMMRGGENARSEFLPADLVIVNADLPYATKSLLKKSTNPTGEDDTVFDWDNSFSFSSGVISFHWSVKETLHELNTHNVFMSAGSKSEAESSWAILRSNSGEVEAKTPFNFYVHRAGKIDPSVAPDGCDSIMVLVPCRTLLRDDDCATLPREEALRRYRDQFSASCVDQARKAVLARMAAIPSLSRLPDLIVDEVVDTPATWAEQFNLAAGTPFALSHGFSQLSITRPGHYATEHKNVLFCGASTRPGNGVPLVLIGAKQVAEKAVRKLQY